jgi:hypothetical protein
VRPGEWTEIQEDLLRVLDLGEVDPNRMRVRNPDRGIHQEPLDHRFKSPSPPPPDASPGLLPYSILRLAPPRGSCDSPGLAIQIGYTSEGLERSPGARERETERPLPISLHRVTALCGIRASSRPPPTAETNSAKPRNARIRYSSVHTPDNVLWMLPAQAPATGLRDFSRGAYESKVDRVLSGVIASFKTGGSEELRSQVGSSMALVVAL